MGYKDSDIKVYGRFWSETTDGKIIDAEQIDGFNIENGDGKHSLVLVPSQYDSKWLNEATGSDSIAFGIGSKAFNSRSIAMLHGNWSMANAAFVIGLSNKSWANGSFTFGNGNIAGLPNYEEDGITPVAANDEWSRYSIVGGYLNNHRGQHCITVGESNTVQGNSIGSTKATITAGLSNTVTDSIGSAIFGQLNTIDGEGLDDTACYNIVAGSNNYVRSKHSAVFGLRNNINHVADYGRSFIAGVDNETTAATTMLLGRGLKVTQGAQVAVGEYNKYNAINPNPQAIAPGDTEPDISVRFAIGNGNKSVRSNAFEVYSAGGFTSYGDSYINGDLNISKDLYVNGEVVIKGTPVEGDNIISSANLNLRNGEGVGSLKEYNLYNDENELYTEEELAIASGFESFAFGKGARATGKRSFSFGNLNQSHGNTSFTIGQVNINYANGALVGGNGNRTPDWVKAEADHTRTHSWTRKVNNVNTKFSQDYKLVEQPQYSLTCGLNNFNGSQCGFVTGHYNGTDANDVIIGGYENKIFYNAPNSMVGGTYNIIDGVTKEDGIKTFGGSNLVVGSSNKVNSADSAVFGTNNIIDHRYNSGWSLVAGAYNKTTASKTFLLGEGLRSTNFGLTVLGAYNDYLGKTSNGEIGGGNNSPLIVGNGESIDVATAKANGLITRPEDLINNYYIIYSASGSSAPIKDLTLALKVWNGEFKTIQKRTNAFEVKKEGGFNSYGNSKIEGELTASKFIGDLNGIANRAIADENGNNIINTYAKKNDIKVTSVNNKTGAVTLSKSDINLGSVINGSQSSTYDTKSSSTTYFTQNGACDLFASSKEYTNSEINKISNTKFTFGDLKIKSSISKTTYKYEFSPDPEDPYNEGTLLLWEFPGGTLTSCSLSLIINNGVLTSLDIDGYGITLNGDYFNSGEGNIYTYLDRAKITKNKVNTYSLNTTYTISEVPIKFYKIDGNNVIIPKEENEWKVQIDSKDVSCTTTITGIVTYDGYLSIGKIEISELDPNSSFIIRDLSLNVSATNDFKTLGTYTYNKTINGEEIDTQVVNNNYIKYLNATVENSDKHSNILIP